MWWLTVNWWSYSPLFLLIAFMLREWDKHLNEKTEPVISHSKVCDWHNHLILLSNRKFHSMDGWAMSQGFSSLVHYLVVAFQQISKPNL